MPTRSTPTKTIAERSHPYRVDIAVPEHGLGIRINEMHAWCRQRNATCVQHSHRQPRQGNIPLDHARFYFMGIEAARAFRDVFGGVLTTVQLPATTDY